MREGIQKFTLQNGETVIAKKGDIVYLPPDITYVSEWETDPNGKAVSILFSLGEAKPLSDNLFIIIHDKYEIYLNLFLNFISHYEKQNKMSGIILGNFPQHTYGCIKK